jgi:murein DD-endopeptidase MepM/ murein hydrolase activator NlpD
MQSESVKVVVAASLLGGLLFCFVSCSMPQQDQAREDGLNQVKAEGAPSGMLFPSPEVVVSAATATLTPLSQTPTPPPTPTSTLAAMPIPTPESGPFAYHTISEGQTLGYIALIYGTEIDSLVKMNKLEGPSALIQIGQVLRVPVQTDNIAPNNRLLPDSEVVYGPSYIDFDSVDFVNQHGGFLVTYREVVEGEELSGAEIVERVAEQFSVGPRLLLALLEHYGGWVTSPTVTEDQLNRPLGPRNPRGGSLHLALGFTANRINAGYYGYKRDGFWIFHLPDGSQAISAQGINAGTVGLQNILAIHSNFETWQQELGQDGFMNVYHELFGDPFASEFAPVVPIDLVQPPLGLPWAADQGFYYTSGPHGAFADGSAWAAVDFGPPDVIGNCFYSDEPSTAAASGVIVVARQGEVQLDLDGDGNIQTGWVLLYLHVALDFDAPVQIGQRVAAGDVLGYPSCEGGLSNSSHLHLARRYNGEWIDAGGPVPMELAGWVVQPNLTPYEGTMVKAGQVRTACECWDAEHNLIVNEQLE